MTNHGVDLAIAMTTAPRPRPTLERTLASLRRAGFDEEVHLFAEPSSSLTGLDDRVRVHANARCHGCYGNWRQAASYLLTRTSASWLLVLQDDGVWLPDAAAVLRAGLAARGQEDRVGFLSPYVTAKDVGPTFMDGWNLYQGGWNLWGALALCLRRDAAEDLLRHKRFLGHRDQHGVDAVVAASMIDLGRSSFVHVPSLVDHIGETSTIGHDDVARGLRGYRFGEQPHPEPVLTFGAVRLLNVPHAAAVAREIFEEDCYGFEQIPSGAIVIDVGAFYGEFALRCAIERACRVVAYEPSRENRAILDLNRRLNGLSNETLVVSPLAIGTPGPRRFLQRREHPASSLLVDASASSSYDVECADLDGQIELARERWGDLPICVKMDCEGAEHEIFEKQAWLDRVVRVVMEWHCYDGDHFRKILEARGFEVHLEGGGPKPRPAWDPTIGGGLLIAARR